MKKILFLLLVTLLLTACSGTIDTNTDGSPDNSDDGDDVELTLECVEGLKEFDVKDTPIKFCYQDQWATPEVTAADGTSGERVLITFPNAEKGPVLLYQSGDYIGPEGDEYAFDYNRIALIADEVFLTRQVADELGIAEDQMKLRKTSVGDKKAVRVHMDKSIDEMNIRFYIPNAFNNHHILLMANEENALELDEFAFDIVF